MNCMTRWKSFEAFDKIQIESSYTPREGVFYIRRTLGLNSPIELPKLPKILVNKNLSINFERFSLFRNAPGCIDKDGYYYDDNNRNLNGNGDSNNRVTNVYL
ncbi:11274_t:CDS:2 [Entrophospora sp. SA101]|nr:11274_t:CDS:2 [Entrophospora sp. SA101]